jgi:hypothetical protein
VAAGVVKSKTRNDSHDSRQRNMLPSEYQAGREWISCTFDDSGDQIRTSRKRRQSKGSALLESLRIVVAGAFGVMDDDGAAAACACVLIAARVPTCDREPSRVSTVKDRCACWTGVTAGSRTAGFGWLGFAWWLALTLERNIAWAPF